MTPYFQPVPLRCAHCGHRWTGYVAIGCSFRVAIASMTAISDRGCPDCPAGGNAVLIELVKPEIEA